MILLTEHYRDVFSGGTSEPANVILLPGGELHPQLGDELSDGPFTVVADTRNSEDLFAILMVHNALKRNSPGAEIHLKIGYVPYARQDRVANPGEALSIEAMADFINMMQFKSVTIFDPHSDVTPALIRNCHVVSQADIFDEYLILDQTSGYQHHKLNPAEWVLVCPDNGAVKKTDKLAKKFGFAGVVYMDKNRDTQTGKITGTFPRSFVTSEGVHEHMEELEGKRLLVVDDICDGGYTFIQIANELRTFSPKDLYLYVTHGLFTKGLDVVVNAGYNRIITTNAADLASHNYDNWNCPIKGEKELVGETEIVRLQVVKAFR